MVLSPSQFGIVRSVESTLAVVLVFASLGHPTLMIREIAASGGDEDRVCRFRTIAFSVGVVSFVAAGLAFAVLTILPLDSGDRVWLRGAAGLLILSPLVRTTANWFQGQQAFNRFAFWSSIIGGGVLVSTVTFVALLGLRGWLIGRYVGELLAVLVVIGALHQVVGAGGWRAFGSLPRLWREGAEIAAALGFRTLMDNLSLIMLGLYLGYAHSNVGVYGFATLLWMGALVPGGAMAATELPRLSGVTANREALSQGFRRAVRRWFLPVSGACVVLSLGIAWGIPALLPRFSAAVVPGLVLIVGIPFRTTAMISGSVLVVTRRNRLAAAMNLSLVLLSMPVLWAVVKHGDLALVALTVLTFEILGCGLFVSAAEVVIHWSPARTGS